jgi:hypothetical protein
MLKLSLRPSFMKRLMKAVLFCVVLVALMPVRLSQSSNNLKIDDDQAKVVVLPKIKRRVEVSTNRREIELEPLPIMNWEEIKGKQIENCDIIQAKLHERNGTKFINGVFPVSLDKRWYRWIGYADAQFLIYREDRRSPLMSARFSRAGLTVDLWNIRADLIKDMEGGNIRLMRDTVEENGPNVGKNSALYLYVFPRTIVYQEINFLGKQVRVKEYQTDYDLLLLDAVAYNRRIYMIKTDSMLSLTVNEDKMMKNEEIPIPPNKIVHLGLTLGKVFIFVLNSEDGMSLVASTTFSIDSVYTHIKGKRIRVYNAGNRSYVFFVLKDLFTGEGEYYYIVNQQATKPSSLVFEKIPELNTEYERVFEFRDRIHFIKGNQHEMFMKGSKKSLIKYTNNNPIIGVVYWSFFQYLEEDQFLTVADQQSNGILKLANIDVSKPLVSCPPRIGSIEKYEKFSVFNKKNEYQFEVVFLNTGKQDFIAGTFFEGVFCVLAGLAITFSFYIWYKRTLNNVNFEKMNLILKIRREAETGVQTKKLTLEEQEHEENMRHLNANSDDSVELDDQSMEDNSRL